MYMYDCEYYSPNIKHSFKSTEFLEETHNTKSGQSFWCIEQDKVIKTLFLKMPNMVEVSCQMKVLC